MQSSDNFLFTYLKSNGDFRGPNLGMSTSLPKGIFTVMADMNYSARNTNCELCVLTRAPPCSLNATNSYVPQDQAGLIHFLGGPDRYVQRLDFLHESGLLDIGNEPSFLVVYLYHYAGRPGLSATRARSYVPSAFNASHSGLPGNDDSGAMNGLIPWRILKLYADVMEGVRS